MVEAVKNLFDEMMNAYIEVASDSLSTLGVDEEDEEYRYEMSRIMTLAESWKSRMSSIIDEIRT